MNRVSLKHRGQHTHPQPPVVKPTLKSLKILDSFVKSNPTAVPVQMHTGIQGQRPLPEIDPAFNNVDVLAHHRRKFLGKLTGPFLKGHGIRGTTGALFQLTMELPPSDVKYVHVSSNCQIVTIQTEGQKWVINNAPYGLKSDTVHKIIQGYDLERRSFGLFHICP